MQHSRILLISLLVLACAWPLAAGGPLQSFDVTAREPSPVEGQVVVQIVPRRWDDACLPITFRVDEALDPIPNPLGADFLTVAEAVDTLQAAADVWNDIDTSYVELQVTGTVLNDVPGGFDLDNEITFQFDPRLPPLPRVSLAVDFGAIAYQQQTVLIEDFDFPDGLDLDGDGDADVSDTIETCTDLDGDGDREFPAKVYSAGSILEVDIVFAAGFNTLPDGPDGFRFTTTAAEIDDNPQSVDLYAIALEHFGLAHGVAHNAINQRNRFDGRESAMFPTTDTSDVRSQLAERVLDVDSKAISSWLYPEGSAATGRAALQPGDRAFDSVYGIISGNIHSSELDLPLAGANVFATDARTGRVVSTTINGTTVWTAPPAGFGSVFIEPEYHLVDGHYELIVPAGVYTVGIEPVDDEPVLHNSVNLNTILSWTLDIDNFHEEYYNGRWESANERWPGLRVPVRVAAGEVRTGIDFITNRTVTVANFGSLDALGSPSDEPGAYYAVRIPTDAYLAADEAAGPGAVLHGGEFMTGVAQTSNVPMFAEAIFTTGTVHADGSATINLDKTLAKKSRFVAQDFDFSPFYISSPLATARKVRRDLARGKIDDLFLVLRLPLDGELPLIGLDGGSDENDVPIFGDSFISTDGQTFEPSSEYNFLFRLVFGQR